MVQKFQFKLILQNINIIKKNNLPWVDLEGPFIIIKFINYPSVTFIVIVIKWLNRYNNSLLITLLA
jgi:hypothetical protein